MFSHNLAIAVGYLYRPAYQKHAVLVITARHACLGLGEKRKQFNSSKSDSV
jgi:hypothetical protein